MADQSTPTELVEQLKELDLVFHIQSRLGMYVTHYHNYECVYNFYRGFNVGKRCGSFTGFHEFLVRKVGCGHSQGIYGLILALCFGDDSLVIHEKMKLPENHLLAIECFFSQLKEFETELKRQLS